MINASEPPRCSIMSLFSILLSNFFLHLCLFFFPFPFTRYPLSPSSLLFQTNLSFNLNNSFLCLRIIKVNDSTYFKVKKYDTIILGSKI